jgi:hypothetical protein
MAGKGFGKIKSIKTVRYGQEWTITGGLERC